MSFLGGLAGFLISGILYVITAAFLGVPVFVFNPLAVQIAPVTIFLLSLLTPVTWIIVAVFALIILTVFAYALATIGLLPSIATAIAATTPAPPPPVASLPNNLLENFMRGLVIGLTAGVNLGIVLLLWPTTPGAIGGSILAFIGFLAVFPAISGNGFYQGLLGWSNWLRPFTYLATALGILLFLINLPIAIAAAVIVGGPFPVRFDFLTSTVETFGGIIALFTTGGFNLGNFTFLGGTPTAFNGVNPIPGGMGATGLIGGLSSHETGHTLNAGAYGGIFHWINAIDENVVPFSRNSLAYGELTAESHFQEGGVAFGVGSPPPVVPRQNVNIW